MCQDAVDRVRERDLFITAAGKSFCIRTGNEDNPHLASVRVVEWNKDEGILDLDVTVWPG